MNRSLNSKQPEDQTHFQTDTLAPFLRLRGCGINYATAWVKLSNRTAPYTVINPRMVLSGISSVNGVEVLEAYLYWIVEGNRRTSSVRLTGPAGSRLVNGQLIGLGRGGKCWPCANTLHYRADVKDLFCRYDPNGEYLISDYPQGHRECRNPPDCRGGIAMPGGCDQGDTDGAMLLVIYRDYSANYEGTLAVDDGCIIRLGGDRIRYTVNAASSCGVPNEARGFIALGDLQAGSAPPHNLTIGPVTFPIQPRFFNLESAPLGFTTSNLTTNFGFENLAGGDCYSILLAGVYSQSTACQPACNPVIQQVAEPNGRLDTVHTCQLSGPLTLNLSGHEGTILRWERSDNCSTGSWTSLSQTQSRLAIQNPSTSACWRVVINRNGCITYSSLGRIQVNGQTTGGQAGPDQRVCQSQQPGIVQLSGTSGRVIRWERAMGTDCKSPRLDWELVSGTQNAILPPAAEASSCWRAWVKEGDCDPTPSEAARIEVIPGILPGRLALEGGDCTTGQGSFLVLNGPTGNRLTWQFAPSCNGPWQTTGLNGTRHPVAALTVPGCYRVLVGSTDCDPVSTEPLEIRETTGNVPGTLVAAAEHCSESGPLEIRLVNSPARILQWEWSGDRFQTSNTISRTDNPLMFNWPRTAGDILDFRVWVQLGNCSPQPLGPVSVRRVASPPQPSIQGPATVCLSNGSLTLTANPANIQVLFWEFQTNGGSNWTRIENPQRTLLLPVPSEPTSYRVISSGGACPPLISEVHTLRVSGTTQPGRVSGGGQFCTLGQTVELNLTGHEGQVLGWERSPNGQFGWSPISGNGTRLTIQVESTPFWYRARVQNSSCPAGFSMPDSVVWKAAPTPGQITGPSQVCSGTESFRLVLNGNTAPVIYWEQAIGNSTTWTTIPGSSSSELPLPPISQPTRYRAVIRSPDCPPVTSASWSVALIEPARAGQLTGAATGCGNTLNARLELTGFSGTILRWESQILGSDDWNIINHTEPILQINTLALSTRYRVVVGRGSCTPAISLPTELTVIPPSSGGRVSADATICRGQPAPTLRLTNYTGRILDWFFSKDQGTTWIAMRKPDLIELNTGRLTVETWFRAEVQAHNCPAAYSEPARIQVREMPRAGWISGDTAICEQNNGTTLSLQDSKGTLSTWQRSTDGINWFNFATSGLSLQTGPIRQTTWYRVLMASNGCAADTSPSHRVALQPLSAGGALLEDRSICSGGTSGQLQLHGHRGSIRFWEISENQGQSWTTIAYTGQGFASDPLYRQTWYRVAVQNGNCPLARSSPARITLVNKLSGGRLTGGPAFCSNAASLTLSLISSSGSVRRWEFSTDEGKTWVNLSHEFTKYTLQNLTQPTRLRVLVQSGSCAEVYSTEIRIEPKQAPTLYASGSVGCEGWGLIEAQARGGSGSFLYSLGESNHLNSHGRFAPLEPRNWMVSVRDAAGCTDTQFVDLSRLEPRPDIEQVMLITASSATILWRQVPGLSVRYRVTYQVAGQPASTRVSIDGIRSNVITLNGLQHDTPYEVRIEANCSGRIVEAAWPAFFRTLPLGDCNSQPPPPPGGLGIDRISPFTAVLRWSPIRNLTHSQGYIISFGREEINPNNWPQFVVCAPDSQFFIGGLSPSTRYAARIRTNCTNCTTALQSTDRRSAWSQSVPFQTQSVRVKSESHSVIESETELVLYPNPCRDELNVYAPASGQLTLVDALGHVALSQYLSGAGLQSLNVSNLARGVYTVVWRDDRGINRRNRLILID